MQDLWFLENNNFSQLSFLFSLSPHRFEFTIYSNAITITKNVTNSKALSWGLTDKKRELFYRRLEKGGKSHFATSVGAAELWNFPQRKSFHAKILGVFRSRSMCARVTTIDVNFLMVSKVIFYTLECCLKNMGKLDALRSAKRTKAKMRVS